LGSYCLELYKMILGRLRRICKQFTGFIGDLEKEGGEGGWITLGEKKPSEAQVLDEVEFINKL
jgi:hypothetical protein